MAFSLDALKDKAGPLPIWAWGLIVGVLGVAGYWWFSSRSASSGGASEAVPASEAYPELAGSASTSTTGTVTNLDGSSDSALDFATNYAWMVYVSARMVATGANPLTVQAALQAYLDGDDLTDGQAAIVNTAVSKYGMPPNGTSGVSKVVKTPLSQSQSATGGTPTAQVVPQSLLSLIGSSLGTTASTDTRASAEAGVPVYVGGNGNVAFMNDTSSGLPGTGGSSFSLTIATAGKSVAQLIAEKSSNMFANEPGVAAAYDAAIRAAQK